MQSSMTNGPKVPRKSIRIQVHPTLETVSNDASHPPSAPTKIMPRSILKNRDDGPSTPATVLDPLQCETYLLGPLRTLIVSVDGEGRQSLSLHDVTEAYILLSCRIEAQATNLTDDSLPAVAAVRSVPSHLVCAAIRRDVSRAISRASEADDVAFSQGDMTEEERSHVRDRSSICHASLRFLANLVRFPSLYRSFKLHELAWVMKELLDVGLSNELTTMNPQKTCSLVIFVISHQHLPDSVLRPFRVKIATVLERAAAGLICGNATRASHAEGLRAVHSTLHRHGSLLLPDLQRVLKVTLQNLVCPVAAFRDLAAKALTAFADASLRNGIDVGDQLKFSAIIGAFIDKELQRAKEVNKQDPNTFVLRDFLKLSETDPHLIQRTTLLLNVTAALLVLSGPCVFVRPSSLKFLLKAIAKTQAFRQREINRLRAATWSCLVRAYGLLSSWGVSMEPELEESAFRVVRQEYREDVGVAVIAVLLEPLEGGLRPLRRALEAVNYLYHLGQMPETRGVTAALLRRLIGGVLNDADSETCTWTGPTSVVPEWLSSGSTLGMESRSLKKVLASVVGVDIHAVRILEADELLSTWDSLMEAFQVCAIGQLFDKKTDRTLQSDPLLLWRALLRIQRALAIGFNHDVVSMPVLSRIASILCAFLESTHDRFPIRPSQALLATHDLWKIVNDELGALWGAALACSIYRRVLRIWQHEPASNFMSDEWVQLSRSLILASPKRTLEVLQELHDVDAQLTIWLDMARYVRSKVHPSTEVIRYLLLFPIQVNDYIFKDKTDVGYWDMLFLLALMHDEPEIIFATVAEELGHALTSKPCSQLRQFFLLALSHASRSESPPNLSLVSVMSEYLGESYPPENYEDNEYIDMVPSLQRMLQAKPSLALMKALENGLKPWFQDSKALLHDVIYNNDILPLYCAIFQAIRQLPSKEEAFIDLAELLAAPFSRERIPEPAVGPMAFKELWDSVAPTLKFSAEKFPPILSDCVISLYNAFGGYIPEWMESQLESQNTNISEAAAVVPPSIEDLESSDFSPRILKRTTRAGDDSGTPRVREIDSDAPVNDLVTPPGSPSIGLETPQFTRHRRTIESPAKSLCLERAKKKRRQMAPSLKDSEMARSKNIDEPAFNDTALLARTSEEVGGVSGRRVFDSSASSPLLDEEKQKYMQDRGLELPLEMSSPCLPETAGEVPPISPEDYTSWELRVSSQDVRNIAELDDDKTPRPQEISLNLQDHALGDSVDMPPQNDPTRRTMRSQTVPASFQSSSEGKQAENQTSLTDQNRSPAKLRRLHTTTEVPLDALEKLHARLTLEANFMETQDLAQATKLTHDMLGILNGRMSDKLGNRK